MAKKTNKTEHVLNLLMNRNETEDDNTEQRTYGGEKEKAAASSPLIQTETETPHHDRSAASSQTRSAASSQTRNAPSSHNVMFVDSLQSEDHPIANAIKESLEREAIQMGLLSTPPSEKAAPAYGDADNTAHISKDADKAHASRDAGGTAHASRDAASAPTKSSSVTAQKDAPMPAYRYVNVMERGVAESLMEYMTKLGVCTCDRCQKDVTALAMSNLPPKYIVADTAAVSPLLNFYSNKYSSLIMTELTKACFAVIADPRH